MFTKKLPAKISLGYYETVCDACGKYFCKRLNSSNYIEKYLEIMCCPRCGYGNSLSKEPKKMPGMVSFTTVEQFSIGYEIEFFINNKKCDNIYIARIKNPLNDVWGFDGQSPRIKEYRSIVFTGGARECIHSMITDLFNTIKIIKEIGGELPPIKLMRGKILTFGLHLSFGGDFFDEIYNHTGIKRQLENATLLSLRRFFLKDLYRDHKDRWEYRGFSSSNYINAVTILEYIALQWKEKICLIAI